MIDNTYLKWLSETDTYWWNDSAVLADMDQAIENGATGVTTNPLLVMRSLYAAPAVWLPYLHSAKGLEKNEKIEEIIRCITVEIAKKFQPIYTATAGVQGYVCAQVNPNFQGDADKMIEAGKRLNAWAPNISVKLPGTQAGLEAMEELSSLGITTVGTVSFTVPQAVEIARRQQAGIDRCRKAGKTAGKAFSVIMVGRLDDYLRDVAHDAKADVAEEDIIWAGTACIKRAYAICRERGYESKLMPAGMRGAYHAVELAGADMSFSLSSGIHTALSKESEHVEHIEDAVPQKHIDGLMKLSEFRRAFEPDGMKPEEFIRFGATQRTLSQFVEAGWGPIGDFKME